MRHRQLCTHCESVLYILSSIGINGQIADAATSTIEHACHAEPSEQVHVGRVVLVSDVQMITNESRLCGDHGRHGTRALA